MPKRYVLGRTSSPHEELSVVKSDDAPQTPAQNVRAIDEVGIDSGVQADGRIQTATGTSASKATIVGEQRGQPEQVLLAGRGTASVGLAKAILPVV
jgi:hypothetical protein